MTTTHTDRTRRTFVVDEATAILARTPAALDALLRGLPDGWLAAHEGGESWSPFDVMGHLIHGERTDWIPRVRRTARARRSAGVRKIRSLCAVRGVEGTNARQPAGRVRRSPRPEPARPRGVELDCRRSRSPRTTSGVRSGYAATAAGDVDGARPRSREPDRARDRATVPPTRSDRGARICGSSTASRSRQPPTPNVPNSQFSASRLWKLDVAVSWESDFRQWKMRPMPR